MPDPFPAASGTPEPGPGAPEIPAQNGARSGALQEPGQRRTRPGSPPAGAIPRGRQAATANDQSAAPPDSFLDFLDRFVERIYAKNDKAWPAVFQIALLLPASLAGLMMAAHAAGVPGWAIASGTATSATEYPSSRPGTGLAGNRRIHQRNFCPTGTPAAHTRHTRPSAGTPAPAPDRVLSC